MFFLWFNFLTSVSINSFCSTQRYMQVMDDLNNRPVGDRFYSKKVATIATSVDKFQDQNTNSPPKSPRIEILEVAKANRVFISQRLLQFAFKLEYLMIQWTWFEFSTDYLIIMNGRICHEVIHVICTAIFRKRRK